MTVPFVDPPAKNQALFFRGIDGDVLIDYVQVVSFVFPGQFFFTMGAIGVVVPFTVVKRNFHRLSCSGILQSLNGQVFFGFHVENMGVVHVKA